MTAEEIKAVEEGVIRIIHALNGTKWVTEGLNTFKEVCLADLKRCKCPPKETKINVPTWGGGGAIECSDSKINGNLAGEEFIKRLEVGGDTSSDIIDNSPEYPHLLNDGIFKVHEFDNLVDTKGTTIKLR